MHHNREIQNLTGTEDQLLCEIHWDNGIPYTECCASFNLVSSQLFKKLRFFLETSNFYMVTAGSVANTFTCEDKIVFPAVILLSLDSVERKKITS